MSFVNKKSIAILLATYNGEKFIRYQLDSLLKQSQEDWCCYIHDDGSKDETLNICKKYADNFPNRFIIVKGLATGGAKYNFMYLLKCVESEYYMFCDQDDFWLPDKIEYTFNKMIELNAEETVPKLVFTDLVVVDENLKTIAKSMDEYQVLRCKNHSFSKLLMQNVVTGCTTMINRSLRELMLKPCNLDEIIMHDWWAALIAARFGKIAYLKKATILYRQHGNNSVGAKGLTSFDYILGKLKSFKDIKNALLLTRLQAKEFCKVFGETENSLAYRYNQMEGKTKFSRLWFYFTNGIHKVGLLRNIGLMIVG